MKAISPRSWPTIIVLIFIFTVWLGPVAYVSISRSPASHEDDEIYKVRGLTIEK